MLLYGRSHTPGGGGFGTYLEPKIPSSFPPPNPLHSNYNIFCIVALGIGLGYWSWPLVLVTGLGYWSWLLVLVTGLGHWSWLLVLATGAGYWSSLLVLVVAPGYWSLLMLLVAGLLLMGL